MSVGITPPPAGTTFTKDPVQITTAVFVLLQGIVAILTATSVFDEVLGGILMGVLTAAWGAVNILLVKPATVPRQPLAELAYENQQPASSVMPQSTQVVEVSDLPIDQPPTTGATS